MRGRFSFMTRLIEDRPQKKLSSKEKLAVIGLLCLQVPLAVIFIPLASVLVLTGFLAPFGIMCFAIGTKPFSVAMKLLAERESGRDEKTRQDQYTKVSAAH